jgi:hypothetical protein
MNIISDPFIAFLISEICSSADSLPIFGNPPHPNPFVSVLPIKIFISASTKSRCALSVLIAIISAPLIPFLYSQLVALHPPPPTPITFMLA